MTEDATFHFFTFASWASKADTSSSHCDNAARFLSNTALAWVYEALDACEKKCQSQTSVYLQNKVRVVSVVANLALSNLASRSLTRASASSTIAFFFVRFWKVVIRQTYIEKYLHAC